MRNGASFNRLAFLFTEMSNSVMLMVVDLGRLRYTCLYEVVTIYGYLRCRKSSEQVGY